MGGGRATQGLGGVNALWRCQTGEDVPACRSAQRMFASGVGVQRLTPLPSWTGARGRPGNNKASSVPTSHNGSSQHPYL